MGLPLAHENHYLPSLEMLEMTLWDYMSTKGTRSVQRDTAWKTGRSSTCFVNLDPAAGMNQAGGDSVIHTIYCSARTSTGLGIQERMRKRGSHDSLG